jgi:predicted phage terminase large subunit-like protein
MRKLIINIPPGHAKSMLVSVLWPAWHWVRVPQWRALFSSYDGQLVNRDAVRARTLMRSDWYQELFCGPKSALTPRWGFQSDQDQKSYYENSLGGFRIGVTVGGGITGKRGNCFTGETLVATEFGQMRIEDIHTALVRPRVWGVTPEGLRLCGVEATRELVSDNVGKLGFSNGSELNCTADHRIASRFRYIEAAHIEGGQEGYSLGAGPLCCLQGRGITSAVRSQEEVSKRGCAEHSLLLSKMREGAVQRHSAMSDMPQGNAKGVIPNSKDVLQRRMLCELENKDTTHLPSVQNYICQEEFKAGSLLPCVCEHHSFGKNAGGGKLTLQGWQELLEMVRADAQSNTSEGQGLSDMWRQGAYEVGQVRQNALDSCGASCERDSARQQSRESSPALHEMSHAAPQVNSISVSKPWESRAGAHKVYDLQVEGARNFFANSILVHNCVVVDDPTKAGDAHSELVRDEVIRWHREDVSTRFNDPRTAVEVIIMQRLHEDDLTGHLLRSGGYQHLCLPTEFEEARRSITYTLDGKEFWRDPRTEEGELLFPQLFDRAAIDGLKARLGSFGYSGQHQQNPIPAKGGMLHREWFSKLFDADKIPAFDKVSVFVDASFKGGKDNDRVAIGVVGRNKANAYLLDLVWRPMGFGDTMQAMRDVLKKWPQVRGVYIEDKANGPAIIDQLKTVYPGIIPMLPEGGKEARVAAIAPFIEAGNLYLPRDAPWLDAFINECVSFPRGSHDDALDMVAYALRHLLVSNDAAMFRALVTM